MYNSSRRKEKRLRKVYNLKKYNFTTEYQFGEQFSCKTLKILFFFLIFSLLNIRISSLCFKIDNNVSGEMLNSLVILYFFSHFFKLKTLNELCLKLE